MVLRSQRQNRRGFGQAVTFKDFQAEACDLRQVAAGDGCPRCGTGNLVAKRGIEVGHIFQLRTKYSEALKATVVGVDGKPMKTMDDVIAGVRAHAVNDEVTITYYSGTSKKKARVTLQEKPTTVPNQ